MKVKTSNLSGIALNWAVGIAQGYELSLYGVDPSIRARKPGLGVHAPYAPSKYWNQGGPIIELEKMSVVRGNDLIFPKGNENGDTSEPLYLARYSGSNSWTHGQTPLIAATRCYVASKLGDEVEVPDEIAVNM